MSDLTDDNSIRSEDESPGEGGPSTEDILNSFEHGGESESELPAEIVNQFRRTASPVSDDLRILPVSIGFRDQNINVNPGDKIAIASALTQRWWVEAGCWPTVYNGEVYVMSPKTPGFYGKLPGGEEDLVGATRLMLDGMLYTQGDEIRTWFVKENEARDVVHVIKSVAPTDPDFGPGQWLMQEEYEWTREYLRNQYGDEVADALPLKTGDGEAFIPCHNGVIWLSTYLDRVLMFPHTPGLFMTAGVDCSYDPDAADGWGGGGKPTRWLKFLEEVFAEDPGAITTLQEWFGAIITNCMKHHKMMYWRGRTRSGKGTVMRVEERLLGVRDRKSARGSDRVASLLPQDLNDKFGLDDTIGKWLINIPDARFTKGSAVVVQKLLSGAGGDLMKINQKHLKGLTMQLTGLINAFSNEDPELDDDTGSLIDRFLFIDQGDVSFLGREDRELDRKLEAELTGILHWAIMGGVKINRPGVEFTVTERSLMMRARVLDKLSPITSFINEMFVREEGAWMLNEQLVPMWSSWVETNGIDAKTSAVAMGRAMSKCSLVKPLHWSATQAQAHGLPKKPVRGWFGIRLPHPDE